MSENEVVCTECGRTRPKQVLVCPRHDFRHEEGTHCDHCENEVAKQFLDNVEKQLALSTVAKDDNESTT